MQTLSALEVWKFNRMTIVVGIVGSNGVALAVDRRAVRPARNETELDDCADIYKLVHLKKHKVVYAGVGDKVTYRLGRLLEVALDRHALDFENLPYSLDQWANDAVRDQIDTLAQLQPLEQYDLRVVRSLVVVFYGDRFPEPQLFHVGIGQPSYCAVYQISGLHIAGAVGNSARFFGSQFDYLGIKPPIEKLAFLAAHIVLTAHRIDGGMIAGLDVALIRSSAYRLLGDDEKDALIQKSASLNNLIRKEIFEAGT